MVNVSRMSKSYRLGSVLVESLPEIDLQIDKGEAVIIKGPNGCGKSTLLKILATLIRPSTGSGFVDGISLKHPQQVRKKIAFIPEQLQFDYHLTGIRLYKLMAALRGTPKRNMKLFLDYAEDMGVRKWLNTPLGSYSTGMKKRYTVAMWLAMEPDLLLLDELDASLDQQALGLIADLFKEIDNQRPLTIISVSHLEGFELGKKSKLIPFESLLVNPTNRKGGEQ